MGLVPETMGRILQTLAEERAHGYLIAERLDLSHGYIYTHLKELLTFCQYRRDRYRVNIPHRIDLRNTFKIGTIKHLV